MMMLKDIEMMMMMLTIRMMKDHIGTATTRPVRLPFEEKGSADFSRGLRYAWAAHNGGSPKTTRCVVFENPKSRCCYFLVLGLPV